MRKIGLVIVCILILSACNSPEEDKITSNVVADEVPEGEIDESPGDNAGIRVSDWYRSEKYGRDVIDIINFDDRDRQIKVTTVCYDSEDTIIPSADSEVLTLPAERQWTWIPMCPENTASYTIDIDELD